MSMLVAKPVETVALADSEAQTARELSQAIADFIKGEECLQITLSRDSGERIEGKVPAQALRLLVSLLNEMAQGDPITLIPVQAELSTHQAAAVLHVSRPYLIKLLESGKIPFRKVGAHRRVRYKDLLAYQEQERQARKAVLKELMAEQERLGLHE